MTEPQYLAQDFAEIWGDVGGFRTLVLNEQIDKCQGNVIGKDSEMFPFQVLPLPAQLGIDVSTYHQLHCRSRLFATRIYTMRGANLAFQCKM